MLLHQHNETEAEIMTMLVHKETESSTDMNAILKEMDIRMERSLDNLVYSKYRKLAYFQALQMTLVMCQKRMSLLEQEDREALE